VYDVRLIWSHPYQSGIIEEMMDDTMEALDDDELEEEADAEVEKVLFDLTDGKLGQAGAVGADLPVSAGHVPRNLIGVLSTNPNRLRKKPKRMSTRKPRCSVCRKSCMTSSLVETRVQEQTSHKAKEIEYVV
jgi:hypothetical protein